LYDHTALQVLHLGFCQPDAVPAMSLNGLDNPTVIEAYQIALTEAGGWYVPSFDFKTLLNTKILIVASFHSGFFCGTSQGMK
jgi:hypothetical protein